MLRDGQLAGSRSLGADGQVPGGQYDDDALDTGGGLRPDLVGQGLGRTAVAAGLALGRSHFAPLAFRVTVAGWNVRALRTVELLGFSRTSSFLATTGGGAFEVPLRPESQG